MDGFKHPEHPAVQAAMDEAGLIKPAGGEKLQKAYDDLQAHIQKLWARQATFNVPLDGSKPRYYRSGRDARRAARRGYGLHDPSRSRCQRSAEKRGVRKVWAGQ